MADSTRPPLRLLALLLGLAACEHTEPFTGSSNGVGPFSPGSPVRLTFNPGVNRGASWLPDGSGFLYSQEQLDSPDSGDQCLAVMPQAGGTVTRTICATSDPLGDSINVFESQTVAADGRTAYVRSSMYAFAGRHTPDYAALVLATYPAPLKTTVLEPLSYFGPSGSVDLVRDIVWTGTTSMIYVAEQVTYTCANFGCTAFDTTATGIDIERLDYSTSPPTLSVVPNTSLATSLAAGRADTVYFTVAGSGQVHRRALSTGADTAVFDFGSPVTDLSVSGSRFAGVVSSTMRVVDLVTAYDNTFLKTDTNFHQPALSPDGHRVVVELAPVDTLTGRETAPPGLWMWKLP